MVIKKIFKPVKFVVNKAKENLDEEERQIKYIRNRLENMIIEFLVYNGVNEKEAKKLFDNWFKEHEEIIRKNKKELLEML